MLRSYLLNTVTKTFAISLSGLILLASTVQAAPVSSAGGGVRSGSFGVNLEPIVGYEQVFRATPTPHTSSRITYGARATFGTEKLAGELEYLKGEDTENYNSAPQKIVYKDDKIKLGLKTNHSLSSAFYLTGRAGGQAEKNIKETTNNGVLTVETGDYKYNPYAGAAVGVRIGKGFSASIGSTVIFKDTSDLTKNDFQNTVTFGYSIK